jgi:hypothetical protein
MVTKQNEHEPDREHRAPDGPERDGAEIRNEVPRRTPREPCR